MENSKKDEKKAGDDAKIADFAMKQFENQLNKLSFSLNNKLEDISMNSLNLANFYFVN